MTPTPARYWYVPRGRNKPCGVLDTQLNRLAGFESPTAAAITADALNDGRWDPEDYAWQPLDPSHKET